MSTGAESQGAAQGGAASTQAAGSLLDQITQRMPKAVEKPRRDELIRSLVEESKSERASHRYAKIGVR